MNRKKTIALISLLILISLVFGAGFLIGQTTKAPVGQIKGLINQEAGQPDQVDFSLFWKTWQVLEKKHVERDSLDYQKMIYGAISGMVAALDDPYTVFMEPKESKTFEDDISGEFEGIGAEIGLRGGILTIVAPLEGTPAQQAGLKSGDKVYMIDQTSTADLNLDEAVDLIRGPKGEPVKLLITREGLDEPQEIEIIRDTINIPILKYENIEGIAYLAIYHFTGNLPLEFKKIVERIKQDQPQGIVLDLRNNPGGYLEVAINLASWYLAKGEIVVIEDFGNGERKEYRSDGLMSLADFPTVVLINQGSASASEILAGALRDNRGIEIVGKNSFGKGSVQELIGLNNDLFGFFKNDSEQKASLKVTTSKWLTPAGVSIQDGGISPDFEVDLTQEDFEANRDPQLQKALELLK